MLMIAHECGDSPVNVANGAVNPSHYESGLYVQMCACARVRLRVHWLVGLSARAPVNPFMASYTRYLPLSCFLRREKRYLPLSCFLRRCRARAASLALAPHF